MDLEGAVAELYAAAPEDFMARRTALVGAARAAKDRQLAVAIGQLRKPTRSAWLVNLLAREAADELTGLLAIGAALRQAQASLSGADLRRLSTERHRAVESLARQAAALAAAHGRPATDANVQEVVQTLQAALADPAVEDEVRAGRLTQPLSYGGFGAPDGPALLTGGARGAGGAGGPDGAGGAGADLASGEPSPDSPEAAREAAERAAREQAARAAREEAARRELVDAQADVERAQAAAEAAATQLADLQAAVAQAAAVAADAQDAVDRALRRVVELTRRTDI